MKKVTVFLKKSLSLLVIIFVLLVGISAYFTSCTQTQGTKETMSPERQKAIEDSLLKLREFDIAKYWSTGYEYYKNKNYEDAKKYFLRILTLDPDMKLADKFHYKNIHGLLAQSYIELNKPDSTEWAFMQGVEHFSDNGYYLESLGYINRSKNAFDKAIMYYEQAIKVMPEKPELYKSLGDLYYQNGQVDKAIEAYETLIKLKPEDREAQEKYAAMLRSAGRLDEADAQKELLLQSNPNDTGLMLDLGKTYYRNYEYEKALEKFEMLVDKQPENVEAWTYIAGAQMNLEQYDAAIQSYKKINELKPNDVEILCSIANAYRMKKDFVTARQWARRAMSANPQSGLPNITLGDIYSATVEYCANKKGGTGFDFNDKLVYELAYQEYQKAKSDPSQIDAANRLMKSLEPYLPTTQDKFMRPNQKQAEGDCYSWIY